MEIPAAARDTRAHQVPGVMACPKPRSIFRVMWALPSLAGKRRRSPASLLPTKGLNRASATTKYKPSSSLDAAATASRMSQILTMSVS